MLFKELMTDGLSLENKRRYKILHMVDAPAKPLVTPIPDAGAVFEYRFVSEVDPHFVMILEIYESRAAWFI